MSGWVKIPEEWFDSEQVESLPADALMVHLSALGQCARHGRDGRVPRSSLRRLWPAQNVDGAVAQLVTAGWWMPTAVGWQIREWQPYVLSADEIAKRQEQGRIRQERYRRHQSGDHSMCDRCAFIKRGNASRDQLQNASVTPLRSDPTRRGGEERAGADSAGAPSVRLGVPTHRFSPETDCCPLPPENPIHQEIS